MKSHSQTTSKLLSAVICLCLVNIAKASGTTPNIEEIFIGRCHDFTQTLDASVQKDCQKLWKLFSEAFSGKQPCGVTVEDYDEFANEVAYDLPKDKHMFWSGVYIFVHQLTYRGTRYLALSDILTGYLADRLEWCGDTGGINYNNCPGYGSCQNEAQMSFWRSVSRVFASKAHGEAFVMLNGTRSTAYRNNSVFAEYELSYLEYPRVLKLTAYIASDLDSTVRETCDCSECSIRHLEADVKKKGIQFACEDNPLEVLHLLCVDSPCHPKCRKLRSRSKSARHC